MESRLQDHRNLSRFLRFDGKLPSRLHEVSKGSLMQRTFEDDTSVWTILGTQAPTAPQGIIATIRRTLGKYPLLDDYEHLFSAHLGKPIKNSNETVLSKETELEPYIQYLNRMNGFLFGAIAMERGFLTLEQLAICLIMQQGGIIRPLVNLFDGQIFYGKKTENSNAVEMARICPFPVNNPNMATIEYMVCFSK